MSILDKLGNNMSGTTVHEQVSVTPNLKITEGNVNIAPPVVAPYIQLPANVVSVPTEPIGKALIVLAGIILVYIIYFRR